jgi:tRNA(Arg) A34 adenosine deaminase TadA
MGALLVKSGRVLGGDVNVPKISPSTPPNRVSTHAEIRVLKNTRNVRGATLYVARLRSKDIPALAKPCSWCMQEILDYGISRVVFTTNHSIGSSFYTDMITWSDVSE